MKSWNEEQNERLDLAIAKGQAETWQLKSVFPEVSVSNLLRAMWDRYPEAMAVRSEKRRRAANDLHY